MGAGGRGQAWTLWTGVLSDVSDPSDLSDFATGTVAPLFKPALAPLQIDDGVFLIKMEVRAGEFRERTLFFER